MDINKIKEILYGIDLTEIESDKGWWETSTGASFGAQKLYDIISLILIDQSLNIRDVKHVNNNEYKMITLKLSNKQIEDFKKLYSLEQLHNEIIKNFSDQIRKDIK